MFLFQVVFQMFSAGSVRRSLSVPVRLLPPPPHPHPPPAALLVLPNRRQHPPFPPRTHVLIFFSPELCRFLLRRRHRRRRGGRGGGGGEEGGGNGGGRGRGRLVAQADGEDGDGGPSLGRRGGEGRGRAASGEERERAGECDRVVVVDDDGAFVFASSAPLGVGMMFLLSFQGKTNPFLTSAAADCLHLPAGYNYAPPAQMDQRAEWV